MENANTQLLTLQYDEIQNLCNKIIDLENTSQNDDEVVKELKKGYKLSKDDIASIKSLLLGKKKSKTKKSNEDIDSLKAKLNAFCIASDISTVDRKGESLTFKQIKAKAANKKALLNKSKSE